MGGKILGEGGMASYSSSFSLCLLSSHLSSHTHLSSLSRSCSSLSLHRQEQLLAEMTDLVGRLHLADDKATGPDEDEEAAAVQSTGLFEGAEMHRHE